MVFHSAQTGTTPTSCEGMRVLLVEDDVVARARVAALMRQGGAAYVDQVGLVGEAFARLDDTPFDCVVLDLGLPDRDGAELMRRIQARQKGVAVVVLTACTDERRAVELMKAGARDYVFKRDLDQHAFVRTVRSAVLLQRAEATAARAEADLRERVAFERQLIAMVSHDLRNPVGAMTMAANSALKKFEDQALVQSKLSRIAAAGERSLRLIADFLDMTQVQLGGGIPICAVEADLGAVAAAAVAEVGQVFTGRVAKVNQVGSSRGRFDGDRMAQLLVNLLGNAFCYSPPDSPVRVTIGGDDGELVLEVHNLGPPIPAAQLPGLFEPLSRGDHRGPNVRRSIGMGLFIVRAIAQAHGGDIRVRSEEGFGTAFTVRQPRWPAA